MIGSQQMMALAIQNRFSHSVGKAIDRYRRVRRLLRLTPFDTATEDGRSDERHRNLILSASAAAIAKVAMALITMLTIPMTLRYLGAERFGVWMTITSFVLFLSFTDFGIGNGLVTALSQASGRNDRREMRELISSGFLASLAIAIFLFVGFALAYAQVPWAAFLNVHGASEAAEVGPSIYVLLACLAVSMPAGLATRVQGALQRGFAASLVQIAAATLSLLGLVTAIHLDASLPWLVGAFLSGGVLAQVVNSFLLFGLWRPDLRPSFAFLSERSIRRLVHLGLLFFLLQLSLAIGIWSDNIIIARTLGPAAIPDYSITSKLFGFITTVVAISVAPLWPAFGEAQARGDRAWSRRTLIRSMSLSTGLAVLCALALAALLGPILDIWVGGRVHPSPFLIASIAGVTIFECWRSAVAVFLNGTGALRLLVFVDIGFAVTCVLLRIWLIGKIGLPGIPLATLIAYLVVNLGPIAFYIRRQLKQSVVQGLPA
jgi:O-antigen/teichoic acid export membrane protein